jgi:class 3 adenylate cyclase
VDGRLDLSGWDFGDGNVDLRGDWSVCWGQLLLPGADCPSGWTTVGVRGLWSDDSARSPFGGKGVATYRLHIALPAAGEPELSLAAGAPLTAYRLWIDGEDRGGAGVVGLDEATSSSDPRRNRVFSLRSGAGRAKRDLELSVQIANFEFRGGGIRRPWLIGRPDDVLQRSGALTVRDALLSAISVIIGVASLVQFALRRSEPSRLYFGLFSLVMAIRMVPGSISDFTQIIVPWATFAQLLRAEYLGTSFALACGLGYLVTKFPDWTPPRPVVVLQLILLAIAPIVAFAPLAVVIETLPFFLVMPPVAMGFMLLVCARAWWRGAREVLVTLIAGSVFSVAVIHDVVRTVVTDFGFTVELFPYFFVIWLSAEAYELAERFTRQFRREESLSAELAQLNFELQETESAVDRFIPFDLLTLLGKHSIQEVEAGDHLETVASVLHCDLRSVRDSVGASASDTAAQQMNELVRRLTPLVQRGGGVLNGHHADGLQAFFPAGADAATRTAIEVLELLRSPEQAPLNVGIGIDTGPLLVGVFGEDERLIGGAIGPAASRAERIAALTRACACDLLVSATTREKWEDATRYVASAFDEGPSDRSEIGDLFEVRDSA